MRVASSQYDMSSSNPYQEDKVQLLSYMDGIKKAVEKKDFESAKEIVAQSEKLFDKKTNKRLSEQLAPLKNELTALSDAINNKDATAVKNAITNVQDELKSNKNLVLKTHNMADIKTSLRAGLINALYA